MRVVAPETFGPLGDATLVSLGWEQDGRDVAIALFLGDGSRQRFIFTWVSRLSVSIEQQTRGPSQPFSWDGGAERLPSGRVEVRLDFADQGSVSLECEQITADGA